MEAIYETLNQGYMTQEQYGKELVKMTQFKESDCLNNGDICQKKINNLIAFHQHNNWRHYKKWRPLSKKLGFTNGGKQNKSRRTRRRRSTGKRHNR